MRKNTEAKDGFEQPRLPRVWVSDIEWRGKGRPVTPTINDRINYDNLGKLRTAFGLILKYGSEAAEHLPPELRSKDRSGELKQGRLL